jgi:acyl dehydratase
MRAAMKYWDDIKVGDRAAYRPRTVTAEEIVEFGRKYDTQPFHIDAEAAKETMFGGLIASGWHTCAVMMSMLVESLAETKAAGLGSPGIESCRWPNPVRAGDTLTGESEVLEVWPSKSKPMGFTRGRTRLVNQRGELVLELVGLSMYARRPGAAA